MVWRIFLLISQFLCTSVWSWGSEKVLLRDLSAITLHQGQMTAGRRSSPVPQLKCTGGSAGCSSFVPQTVQCRNVGFDGYEVQWECKTDMDDSYRFGKIQVSCEGYDYPDDPYVLKGSCGLEYTIDLTDAGKARSNSYGGGYNYQPGWKVSHDESGGGWIFFVIIVGIVVCMISRMGSSNDCANSRHGPDLRGPHQPHSGNRPPPPGFKPEYTQPNSHYAPPPSYSDATNSAGYSSTHAHTTGGGGFWSGLGLGGLAGYLFGSRRGYGYHHHSPRWGYGRGYSGGYGNSWGSGWGGSSWGNGGSSWTSSNTSYRGCSSSSGTSRTSSGYGGTKRR